MEYSGTYPRSLIKQRFSELTLRRQNNAPQPFEAPKQGAHPQAPAQGATTRGARTRRSPPGASTRRYNPQAPEQGAHPQAPEQGAHPQAPEQGVHPLLNTETRHSATTSRAARRGQRPLRHTWSCHRRRSPPTSPSRDWRGRQGLRPHHWPSGGGALAPGQVLPSGTAPQHRGLPDAASNFSDAPGPTTTRAHLCITPMGISEQPPNVFPAQWSMGVGVPARKKRAIVLINIV